MLKRFAKTTLLAGLLLGVLSAKMVSFTDVVGNKISLDVPAKRVGLGMYYTDYLAVSGVKGFENIKGFSKTVWRDWTPKAWQLYVKAMPQIDKIPDFGEGGTLSVEKIMDLNLDVLVLSKMQYEAAKDILKPLKDLGVKIIAVDFHKGSLENHKKSIEIFGLISGQEARAKSINDEYEFRLNRVKSRVAHLKDSEKKRVYVEYAHGNKDLEAYGLTYSHFMWGALIDNAGGINISDGMVSNYGPANPEAVVAGNPQVAFLIGSDYKIDGNSYAMPMGNGATFKMANERIKGYLKRNEWSELAAVKNGEIFSGDHALLRTVTDIFMLEFVAKAIYPDLFTDLHPSDDFIGFYKKYMPIVPNGLFMMKMDDENFR